MSTYRWFEPLEPPEQSAPRLIFVTGAFNGPSEWARQYNVRKAANCALDVWKRGGVAICPHLNSGEFFAQAPEYQFTEGYLEVLRRCDAIYLVEGWGASMGSRREMAEAQRIGLTILKTIDELETYLGTHPKTPPAA